MRITTLMTPAVAAVALIAVGCGGQEVKNTEQAPVEPVVEETATDDVTEPEPVPTEVECCPALKLGDAITVAEFDQDLAEITVTDLRVEKTAQVEYGEPPKNGHFLIFTVEIEASASTYVDEMEFYVLAKDGTRFDPGDGHSFDAADYDDQLGYVELNAGEKTSGLVVFDVPKPVGELAYAPNYDSGPIAFWAFDRR